jgi:chromate reductase
MHAHLVMGPEVVLAGIHTKLAEDAYQDEKGLEVMLRSLNRLRNEVLARRPVLA